ncbi:unnamed protein product [Caretta caretta]
MRGRKVNTEIEQRIRAPLDGLKCGWEGARLPPVPDHQVRALDPADQGGEGCRTDGLTSLHLRQVARVLDHEEHIISVRQQDQPQLRLLEHQPCQPPTEETEEGLDHQSIQLAQEGAPLPYSWPEADQFSQGPGEPDHILCGGIQHLKKTHKLGSEAKCSQSAQEIPVVYPVKRLLLMQGQEGKRQTIPTPKFEEIPDQIQVVKDGAAQDGVRLVGPPPPAQTLAAARCLSLRLCSPH